MVFLPRDSRHPWHYWWTFSPEAIIQIARSMGFSDCAVSFHRQAHRGTPIELFTVVASRKESGGPGAQGHTLQEMQPLEAMQLKVDCPVERLRMSTGATSRLELHLANLGEIAISSLPPFPVNLSYHWRTSRGEVVLWDGLRTALPRSLYPRDECNVLLTVEAPGHPGEYLLEITVVQESIAWFDSKSTGLPIQIATSIH